MKMYFQYKKDSHLHKEYWILGGNITLNKWLKISTSQYNRLNFILI